MDEHPGDTLGKQFLAFCGSVGVILLFGLALLALKWMLGPKNTDKLDGGASTARVAKHAAVDSAQAAELAKVEEVDAAKGIVRIPMDQALPYAVAVMKTQKESIYKAQPIPGSPAALEAAKKANEGKHDPALSEFEKK